MFDKRCCYRCLVNILCKLPMFLDMCFFSRFSWNVGLWHGCLSGGRFRWGVCTAGSSPSQHLTGKSTLSSNIQWVSFRWGVCTAGSSPSQHLTGKSTLSSNIQWVSFRWGVCTAGSSPSQHLTGKSTLSLLLQYSVS